MVVRTCQALTFPQRFGEVNRNEEGRVEEMEIKEFISVLANIVKIITGITGYMKWVWVKLIIVSIVKKCSSICKFFKWLLDKCFQLIRKITGRSKLMNLIEKQKDELEEIKREFETLKKELEDKIEENDEGKRLYLFLKKKYPNGPWTNEEIIIKSDTFEKTETGYEKHDFNVKSRNKIDSFYENGFEIVALNKRLYIPYEEVYCWKIDKRESDKSKYKMHLHLYSDIVLYEGKIVLENVKSEAQG
jgi:regulator of replication initiation timing